jgi:hypothetical protein
LAKGFYLVANCIPSSHFLCELVLNIAKLIHVFGHLVSSGLVCYALQKPYDPSTPIPPQIGFRLKQTRKLEGDEGFFMEEMIFGGRTFPEGEHVKLKIENSKTLDLEAFLISDERIGEFTRLASLGDTERTRFFIPLRDLKQIPRPHALPRRI